MPTPFEKRLAHHRKQQGLSQNALALLIGVNKSTISYWESGGRSPGVDDLPKIAGALGVTIAELFLPIPEQKG